MAVVAPTGVAAINAGGVTIHSFFQLPLGAYVPGLKNNWDLYNGRVNTQHSLFKNQRLTSTKRDLLRELELLIIDEVSMVRADMIDAIDAVLRHVRKQPLQSFGGVQVLFIGDLFQLPPVIKNEEWEILGEYYKSPFFFDAQVLQQNTPVYIELKKIYRQTDPGFIQVLNNIRNNICTREDLEKLHQHYRPEFYPSGADHYITLTTHNEKAETINRKELDKLPGKSYAYKAEIEGEFYDRSFPAEETIRLKVGAQIMFIKNDKGENRRFYNGKIGVIKNILGDRIYVSFPGETDTLAMEKETWQNIKYNYNKEKDRIEEEELGTFKQYPLRLAWAITIHKSQGLTFDKAIIDAGASFAPGQVYVALSRLTGLKGLVLRSRFAPNSISTDARVLEFVRQEQNEEELQKTLAEEQQLFVRQSLVKGFSWQKMQDALEQHREGLALKQIPGKEAHVLWIHQLQSQVSGLSGVAQKFIRQLEQLYTTANGGYQLLHDRTKAAVDYFSKAIDEQLMPSLDQHFATVKDEKKIKKYLQEVLELKRFFLRQRQVLQYALHLAEALLNADKNLLARAQEIYQPMLIPVEEEIKKTAKLPKGETARVSLQLYKDGKTIFEIARERNLTYGTVEGHLASFITTGEVDVHELIPVSKLDKVLTLLKEEKELPSSSLLKSKLSEDFSYGEIKAAIKYWEKENGSTVR